MYESFFGLARRPFAATPDPDCFVPVETARESLAKLVQCAETGQGIGILTAAAGMGKSLLCAKLIGQLADSFKTVFLANANFPTRRSLLQAILYELGHPYIRMAEQELRLELITAAKQARDESQGVLLVVDEAHLLSAMLLEEIRTITNLVESGEPLTRVILSGQLPLEEKLAAGGLEALNQRIACQVALEPLSCSDSIEFVLARIKSAGGDVSDVFITDALELIARASDGVPRCLNQLCDHSLLLGYASDSKPVGPETVNDALDDLKHLPLHWNEPSRSRTPAEPDAHRAPQSPSSVAALQNSEEPRTGDGDRSEPVQELADQSPAAFESIEIGHDPASAPMETDENGRELSPPQSAVDRSGNESFSGATPDTPSAVFEVGSDTGSSPGSADEVDVDGNVTDRTDGAVSSDGTLEPADEPLPLASVEAAECSDGGEDDDSTDEPGNGVSDTYRLVELEDCGCDDRDTERLEFEEEIIEDRYAQLDAGLIGNDTPRRPARLQPKAAVNKPCDASPAPESDSNAEWADSDPREETPASDGVANVAGESGVAPSHSSDRTSNPVQIIDLVAPLVAAELQTHTDDLSTFDSLVVPADIDPAGCRLATAECRLATAECAFETPDSWLESTPLHWPDERLPAHDAIISLPIDVEGAQVSMPADGLSEDLSTDLDMPPQLIDFSAESADRSSEWADRSQAPSDGGEPQLGVVLLDDWLETSADTPPSGSSSAVSPPPEKHGASAIEEIGPSEIICGGDRQTDPLAGIQEGCDVLNLAATQEFDVVQPEALPPARRSDAPQGRGRTADKSEPIATGRPPAAGHSGQPHGRYDQLFSDLRRRASRQA